MADTDCGFFWLVAVFQSGGESESVCSSVPVPLQEIVTIPLKSAGALNCGRVEMFAVQRTAASKSFNPSGFKLTKVSPPRKMPVLLAGAVTGLPVLGSGNSAAPVSAPKRTARPVPSAAFATIITLGARSAGSTDANCAAGAGYTVSEPAGNPAANGWAALTI